jgi:hypothetical protein
MAQTVKLLGHGGQVRAEKELGWDRGVIRKGIKELESGITCIDNFSARGRYRAEKHLPNLRVQHRACRMCRLLRARTCSNYGRHRSWSYGAK